jgi:hypothetical protein
VDARDGGDDGGVSRTSLALEGNPGIINANPPEIYTHPSCSAYLTKGA